MWAASIEALRCVAVMAENLKPGGKATFGKPGIDGTGATLDSHCLPVDATVAVDVVNAKEFVSRLATAGA